MGPIRSLGSRPAGRAPVECCRAALRGRGGDRLFHASLHDGDPGLLCPDAPSTARSHTCEAANRIVKKADGHVPALRRRLPGSRLVTLHQDSSHGVFAGCGNVWCRNRAAAAVMNP